MGMQIRSGVYHWPAWLVMIIQAVRAFILSAIGLAALSILVLALALCGCVARICAVCFSTVAIVAASKQPCDCRYGESNRGCDCPDHRDDSAE